MPHVARRLHVVGVADEESQVSSQAKRARDVECGKAPALDSEEVCIMRQTGCRTFTPIVTFTAYGYEQHFKGNLATPRRRPR